MSHQSWVVNYKNTYPWKAVLFKKNYTNGYTGNVNPTNLPTNKPGLGGAQKITNKVFL